MTISTTGNRASYAGNGVTTAFSFPYPFFNNADLVVLRVNADGSFATLALGTDYSLTGAGATNGGTVTLTTAPTTGQQVVIYRDPQMVQPIAFVDNDPLPAKSLATGYDTLTLIAQRLRDLINRSFRLSDADTTGANPTLPTPTPNSFLGWDGTGKALVNRTMTDLITVSAYGTAMADKFTGDGATTSFTLSANPGALANLDVSIGGITQTAGQDFTWDGATKLSFVSAPPAPTTPGGTNIYVRYLRALPQGTADAAATYWTDNGGTPRDVASTLQRITGDYVTVTDPRFGAKGDGVTDDTAAFQAATNTGKPVHIPGGKSYRLNGTVVYAGCVTWFGDGQGTRLLTDGTFLLVTNGTGSTVDNLYAENITAPWIITRNPSNWTAVMTPAQSNADGYQPTVNDSDVWPTLTAAQQNQDIGPKIKFQGNASDIVVSRIYGRFVSILMYDTIRSVVRDCDFRGGKNQYAGIVFYNIDNQAGSHNRALNNHIRWASFCGITFIRQYDGAAIGNHVEYVGESGIKTYQNTINGVDARCYRMQVLGNNVVFTYYDGLDLASDYPVTGNNDTRHQVVGNDIYGTRQVGIWGDGQNNQVTNNYVRASNISGIKLTYNYSQIDANFVYDCNQSNTASGEHQVVLNGSNNTVRQNTIRQVVANGNTIYATGTNFVQSNYQSGGSQFLGNAGAVTAADDGNVDAARGLLTRQSFVFVLYNNGTAICHLFKGDQGTGNYGLFANRVNGSGNALTVSPTGADASTAFAAGAKISTVNTNVALLDTASQYAPAFEGIATIELNQSGAPLSVQIGLYTSNVNGVTRTRLGFGLFNATTGAAVPITTTAIPSGQAVVIRFLGKLA